MQRNERIVKHVSQGMRAGDVQRISVVDDRLFVSVSFLEPPRIGDGILAVVQNQRRSVLRDFFLLFSATDRPLSLTCRTGRSILGKRADQLRSPNHAFGIPLWLRPGSSQSAIES